MTHKNPLVEDFINYYTVGDMSDDCVFCKIVKGEIPASVEQDADDVIAFKSIDLASDVHVLIVPKKHISSFESIDVQKHKTIISEMFEVAQALIKKNGIQNGHKLIFNGGQYQAIKHLHWHLLGGDLIDYDKT